MPENTLTLHLHCHCKLASYTLSIPSSSLPLSSAFCHCTSCRHVTGQPAGSFAALPPEITLDVTPLTRYASSDWYTRYFCPQCGAHVVNFAGVTWRVCTGLLDRMEEKVLERNHIFVEDTVDGGMSVWLPSLVAFPKGGDDEARGKVGTYFVPQPRAQEEGAETVVASCHCGGVRFMLTQPEDGGEAAPDVGRGDGRWWLRDGDRRRYAAVLDACESCRRTTGIEVVAWAHVPRVNVRMLDGSLFEVGAGTIRSYQSSSGICRDFCGACGAAVFFRKDGRDGEVWDVAVGLLEAESGARAEGWLGWDADVCFGEEAVGPGMVAMLEEGLRSWKEKQERKGT